MSKTIIDSFTVGGSAAGPSLPGPRLQRLIGTQILVNIETHELRVPTLSGYVKASAGDRIILYEDNTLEVIKRHAPD